MANLEQRCALLENEMESERGTQSSDHLSLKTTRKSRNTIPFAGWTLLIDKLWNSNGLNFSILDSSTNYRNSGGLNLVSRAAAFLITNTSQVPADLKRDIPVPLSVYSPFDNRSDPEAIDEEWEKTGNLRSGVISLSDSHVEEKGLHKAQRLS
ncbi:hypothetical protein BTUL_0002g01780 [Botrytis tulipae]|uniref:Uncharacterized protein n=1 Tax=Botrytis tulipae TaxID=87230 RepID=A0A4Z1F9E2_9HELO|nr:hypothetical protein BTUL_0002g01780 [Botrytis tulipae]